MFQLGETPILAANADTLDPSLMMEEIQRLQAELHATNEARRLAEQFATQESQRNAATGNQAIYQLTEALRAAGTNNSRVPDASYAPEHARDLVRTRDPDSFAGDHRDIERFLSALHLKFLTEQRRFPTDEAKVGYAASLLKKQAFDWFQPTISTRPGTDGLVPSTTLGTYENFVKGLRAAFGDPNATATASQELRGLQYKGNIVAYNNEFRRLMITLGFDDRAKMVIYREGLSTEIRRELIRKDEPANYQELEEVATQVASRIKAFEDEERGRSGRPQYQVPRQFTPNAPAPARDDSIPMDLSATTYKRLPDKEKQRRQDNNLCLYCGLLGHYARDCPNTRRRLAATYQAHHNQNGFTQVPIQSQPKNANPAE